MEKNEKKLTKKDITRSYIQWRLLAEVSHSYERYQSLSMAVTLSKPLRKLYTDDEEYRQALVRHMQFFNTEATIGAIIPGIVLSLEEDRANGAEIPDEVIASIKTGLMGPMAGIGDTLYWGTIKAICFSLAATMALSGNYAGMVFACILFPICGFTIGYFMWHMGYRIGRTSISKILQSGVVNKIIQACSILGLMMMGALSASYVTLTTTAGMKIENSDPILVQQILDEIIPGILPLAVIALIFFAIKKKGMKFNLYIIIIIVLSLVGAFFDIV